MRKNKTVYVTAMVVSVVFIGYTTYSNFIYDPDASRFLRHKTDLKHVSLWLSVMQVHIVAACVAMMAGLINFSSRVRERSAKLHRIIGYGYVLAVAIVDLTSGYMAPSSTGGKASSIAFNFINMIWLAITVIAVAKIRKGKAAEHRKWMIRSYVFVFTNLFTHVITAALHKGFGVEYTLSYTISIYCTIVLLLLLAELVIRRINPDRS